MSDKEFPEKIYGKFVECENDEVYRMYEETQSSKDDIEYIRADVAEDDMKTDPKIHLHEKIEDLGELRDVTAIREVYEKYKDDKTYFYDSTEDLWEAIKKTLGEE